MKTCSKCSANMEDGYEFCTECGTKYVAPVAPVIPEPPAPEVKETVFCPSCGKKTAADAAFCQECGASTKVESSPLEKKEKSPLNLKLIGMVGGAVVVLALASSMLGGGSGNYGLYIQDEELIASDYSDDGDWEVTSSLFSSSSSDDSYYASSSRSVGSFTALTADGNGIFYPDRVDSFYNGVSLYYRELKKEGKDESIKIDSDIFAYAINDKGTQLIYLKGDDGVLYVSDKEEKTKISSDVIDFYVTDDLSQVLYLTDEYNVYLYTVKSGSDEKIASEIETLRFVKEDLSLIYYSKEEGLYRQDTKGGDSEKIASDVYRVGQIYDSGELYYFKQDIVEVNLIDYVVDDTAASDATMEQPQSPNYPSQPSRPYWWDYDDDASYEYALAEYDIQYAAYEAEYNAMRDQYNADYEVFQQKRLRDSLREQLDSYSMEQTEYTLYYYDGTSETNVSSDLSSGSGTFAANAAVGVVKLYSQSDVAKVNLGDITSAGEVREAVNEALYNSTELHVIVEDTLSEIEQEEASKLRISGDGATIYYIDDLINDGDMGELYQVTISKGVVSDPSVYDYDVSTYGELAFLDDDTFLYFKDVDSSENKGDLYVNKNEVDYDVYLWGALNGKSGLYYYTDWNSSRYYGTLKVYNGKESTKIADDVADYDETADGGIRYINDYSTNSYQGSLYLYEKGKSNKVDDDVTALVTPSTSRIKGGSSYGW